MSSVRACDVCGDIFSEAEEGWTTSSQSVIRRRDDGTPRNVQVVVDACPDCSGNPEDTAKKLAQLRRDRRATRLALETGRIVDESVQDADEIQARRARKVRATRGDEEG